MGWKLLLLDTNKNNQMNYKKIFSGITVAIGMLMASEAQDWNGGGSTTNDLWREGNVGIGLGTNPIFKLELDRGDMNILGGYGIRFDGTYGIRLAPSSTTDFILGNGGNFGIGITPTYKLDVNGDINFPISNGLYIGGVKMFATNTGQTSLYLGKDAGMSVTTGSQNSFIGSRAGELTTTGSGNAALGYGALQNNSAGVGNTAVGWGAGGSLTTGDHNVALGYSVAVGLMSGSRNVYIGALSNSSLGIINYNDNTCVGYNTVSAGDENVFLGANVTGWGSKNTLIGTDATANGLENALLGANTLAGGSFNTVLGRSAFTTATDYSTAIGYGAEVAANNTMALGGVFGSGYDVTVVIGTNFPLGLGGTAIGTSVGFAPLQVNGDILSVGALWHNSDKRFKKNINDIADARSILKKLHPVSYEYRDDIYFKQPEGSNSKPVRMNFAKGNQIGFLAQELEEVMPYAVANRTDGFKAVNYNHFFGLLVQGYQEQDKAIEEDKKKIADLETSLAEMKEQNKLLVDAIAEIKAKLNITDLNTGGDKMPTNKAYLEQNSPNPFSENTVIKYFIPETVTNAKIIIRSEQAIEVLSFSLNHKGYGNIIISANTLTTGSYTCELYVENRLVDTKKMLLVK